jgi:predicted alpha/beta-hydrolase family hydrolase
VGEAPLVTTETAIRTAVPGRDSITAICAEPDGDAGWTFIYAPGAGSNVHDPFGTYACRELARRGVACVRFQFPYQETGKKTPDRPEVLEDTWRAAIEANRPAAGRLVVGGRSMGGRIVSQVLAQGTGADALVLFAYPLHPPGKPERARDEHLPSIVVPTLFCSGTNDAFGSPEELRAAAAKVPQATIHTLEAADHGYNTSKSSGRTRQEVWAEAVEAMWAWLSGLR